MSKLDRVLEASPGPLELRHIWARLEQLRWAIRKRQISYGELAELQSLAEYIEPGDVELAEWAGIAEQDWED